MRERKLFEKKRARKGTGRAKTIPVQVSAELHGELSMIKDAYSRRLGRTVTFEQMLRRWIDRLSRIDSDVNDEYQVIRKTRRETEAGAVSTAEAAVGGISERMQSNGTSLKEEAQKEQEVAKAAIEEDRRAAAATGDSPATAEDQSSQESIATPEVAADPTEGDVWDMRYFFEKDGEELEAIVGDLTAFYCNRNGRNTGIATMMRNGWKLMNDAGIELTKSQAVKISDIIRAHNAERGA